MTSVGRRTAVVAASSGLLVSMIGSAAPAMAAQTEDNSNDKLNTVDLGSLTSEARSALGSSPTVSVAADATFTIDTPAITVTPAPKATPDPEPERESPREERASRTSDRGTTATASQETAAAEESAAPTSNAPASAHGSEIISIAARYVGVPYVYGGTTPDGFDCSGFTAYVYAQVGISLPHSSSAQGSMGTKVSRAEAQPGDLVWSPGHIAIYAGDGMIIDAPRPGGTVQFRSMYQSNPTFIRIA